MHPPARPLLSQNFLSSSLFFSVPMPFLSEVVWWVAQKVEPRGQLFGVYSAVSPEWPMVLGESFSLPVQWLFSSINGGYLWCFMRLSHGLMYRGWRYTWCNSCVCYFLIFYGPEMVIAKLWVGLRIGCGRDWSRLCSFIRAVLGTMPTGF